MIKNSESYISTDLAIKGTLNTMIFTLMLNIMIMMTIYSKRKTETIRSNVIVYVILGWVIAAITREIVIPTGLFSNQPGDLDSAFVLLTGIINIATTIIAWVVAKIFDICKNPK